FFLPARLDSSHRRGYTQTRIARRARTIGGASSRSSRHIFKMGNGERGGLLLSVAEAPAPCTRYRNSTSRLIPATTDFGLDKRTHSRRPRRSRGESGSLKGDGN